MWQHPCPREGKLRQGVPWTSSALDSQALWGILLSQVWQRDHSMSLSDTPSKAQGTEGYDEVLPEPAKNGMRAMEQDRAQQEPVHNSFQ